jgi:cytochrome c553
MKTFRMPGGAPVVIVFLTFFAFVLMAGTQQSSAAGKADVKRGEYLVTISGCHDCHSPKIMTPHGPEPDPARLLSGQPAGEKLPPVPDGLFGPDKWGGLCNNHLAAWVGPWGISYASNLTPDRETGTGVWTEELFIKILRTGKFMGAGRPILPPMPWQNFGKMTDDDLRSMFAYLKSLKPVRNRVPDSVPAGPPRL